LPGLSAGVEVVVEAHIERVEADLVGIALGVVELGIGQHPAGLPGTPVFRDPVILVFIAGKVASETDAQAGRDALMAQQSGEQHGVVAAVTHQALGRFTGDGQGGRIEFADTRQHLRHGAQVDLIVLCGRKRNVVEVDLKGMDEQALHDAGEAGNVGREIVEEVSVLARVGDDTVLRIVFQRLDCRFRHTCLPMVTAMKHLVPSKVKSSKCSVDVPPGSNKLKSRGLVYPRLVSPDVKHQSRYPLTRRTGVAP